MVSVTGSLAGLSVSRTIAGDAAVFATLTFGVPLIVSAPCWTTGTGFAVVFTTVTGALGGACGAFATDKRPTIIKPARPMIAMRVVVTSFVFISFLPSTVLVVLAFTPARTDEINSVSSEHS